VYLQLLVKPVNLPISTLTMFRTAILASARAATRACVRRPAAIAAPVARSSIISTKQFAPFISFQTTRCYSASAGLSKDEVQGRIMDLLKKFDKVGHIFAVEEAIANSIPGNGRIKGTPHDRHNTLFINPNCASSFLRLLTSRTTLDWTVSTPWKWSWQSKRYVRGRRDV